VKKNYNKEKGLAYLGFWIKEEKRKKFRMKLLSRGMTVKEVISKFIDEFIRDNK